MFFKRDIPLQVIISRKVVLPWLTYHLIFPFKDGFTLNGYLTIYKYSLHGVLGKILESVQGSGQKWP
jgi:hypothetical protein